MALNIAVCIKPVPDPDHYDKVKIDPVKKTIVREGIPTVINPVDKNAIEAAIRLKEKFGGNIAVISMAPPSATKHLREALAMGADEAYLISDPAFAGSDTLATSYILSCCLKKVGQDFDMILCGTESADGATSQVPSQLGEWMEIPHLWNVIELEAPEERKFYVKTKIENGYMEWEATTPLVLAVSRDLNKPRYISIKEIMKAKNKKLTVLGFEDLKPQPEKIGFSGSPTKTGDVHMPNMKRKSEKIKGEPEEIVDIILEKLRAGGVALDSTITPSKGGN